MTAVAPKLYLLDVEGTVAPLSLVTEQLFPYARAHFREFLEQNGEDADVQADLALLAEENQNETEPGHPFFAGLIASASSALEAVPYLMWLMDHDRKSTALKSLQGRIWKAGFESGELKGTLFPDVPGALERWSAAAQVAIYSSGSVEAQKLLIRFSSYGCLTSQIASYFDTRTGPKTAAASYAAIAAAMRVEPGEVLFLSDVVRELDPAREAGCQTRLVEREGNAPVADANGHERIASFEGV